MKHSLVASVLAIPLTVSSLGRADTIHLKDGTHLDGHVGEIRPGASVQLTPAGGAPQEVPWQDIVRIERHSDAAAANTAAPATSTPQRRRVHVSGPEGATLEADTPGGGFNVVCTLPCNTEQPVGTLLRVRGPGLRPSTPLRVEAMSSEVQVEPASELQHTLGTGLVVGGSAAIALSGMIAYVALLSSAARRGSFWDQGGTAAGALFAGGGAMALLGLPIMQANERTRLRSIAGTEAAIPRAPTPEPPPSSPYAPQPGGRAFLAPVLSGVF